MQLQNENKKNKQYKEPLANWDNQLKFTKSNQIKYLLFVRKVFLFYCPTAQDKWSSITPSSKEHFFFMLILCLHTMKKGKKRKEKKRKGIYKQIFYGKKSDHLLVSCFNVVQLV